MAVVTLKDIRFGSENVVGTRLPRLEAIEVEVRPYALLAKPHWVDTTAALLRDMLELPWLSGIRWQTRSESGEFGEPSKFDAELSYRDLTLTFYTRWSLLRAAAPYLVIIVLVLLTRLVPPARAAAQSLEIVWSVADVVRRAVALVTGSRSSSSGPRA